MPSSRWDRPPPPRDWRWVVGTIGKVLIAVGLLMFGFVAYQLWGTAIEYHQSQDDLADQFAELLAGTTTTSTTTTTSIPATSTTVATSTPASVPATTAAPTTTATTTAPATTLAPPAPGDPLALLEIPTIGVKSYVVQGVEPGDLKHGPGHYPDTPWPGQLGNSAIAGHRTTYGQPFYRLDEVKPGDEIIVTTIQGRFVYRATGSEVVSPSQSDVVATTDPSVARLTLTTCTPRYTASKRLIVFADLDQEASAAPQPPIVSEPTTSPAPPTAAPTTDSPVVAAPTPSSATVAATSTTTTVAPAVVARPADRSTADAFAHGWFSDDAAFLQIALWGLVLTAVSVGAWLLSRQVRRNWVGALIGIAPFVVALYFFFQNVNRLLPAAL